MLIPVGILRKILIFRFCFWEFFPFPEFPYFPKFIFFSNIIMTDFMSAHLAWIKKNPTFSPKYAQDIEDGRTYYKSIQDLYHTWRGSDELKQNCARQFLKSDRLWFENSMLVNQLITKEIYQEKKLVPFEWFVTIGFNHQTWTISKCVMTISKLIAFDWVESCKANFELFRENGEHPHCHFIIKTFEPRSRVVDKLFRPQYLQDVCLKKSFIQINKAELYHYDYINLIKTASKMPYVQQDIIWREKNGIPNFEKNWKDSEKKSKDLEKQHVKVMSDEEKVAYKKMLEEDHKYGR